MSADCKMVEASEEGRSLATPPQPTTTEAATVVVEDNGVEDVSKTEPSPKSSRYNSAHFSASRSQLFDSRTTLPSAAEQHGYTYKAQDSAVAEPTTEDEVKAAGEGGSYSFLASFHAPKGGDERRCSLEAIHDEDNVANLTDFHYEETITGACEKGKSEASGVQDELGVSVVRPLEQAERQPSGCFVDGQDKGVDKNGTKVQREVSANDALANPGAGEQENSASGEKGSGIFRTSSFTSKEAAQAEALPARVKITQEKRKSKQKRQLRACKDSMELIPVRGPMGHGEHSHFPEVTAIQLHSHGDTHGHTTTAPGTEAVTVVRKLSVTFTEDKTDGSQAQALGNKSESIGKKESFQEARRKSESMEQRGPPIEAESSEKPNACNDDDSAEASAKSVAEPRPPESTSKRVVSSPRHKSLEQISLDDE